MYLNLGEATTVLQPTHEEGKQYNLLRKIQKSQGGDVEEIHCLVYYRRRGRFFVGSTAPLLKGLAVYTNSFSWGLGNWGPKKDPVVVWICNDDSDS